MKYSEALIILAASRYDSRALRDTAPTSARRRQTPSMRFALFFLRRQIRSTTFLRPFSHGVTMSSSRSVAYAVLIAGLVACQPRVDTAVDPRTAEAEIRARSQAIVAAEIRKDLE